MAGPLPLFCGFWMNVIIIFFHVVEVLASSANILIWSFSDLAVLTFFVDRPKNYTFGVRFYMKRKQICCHNFLLCTINAVLKYYLLTTITFSPTPCNSAYYTCSHRCILRQIVVMLLLGNVTGLALGLLLFIIILERSM